MDKKFCAIMDSLFHVSFFAMAVFIGNKELKKIQIIPKIIEKSDEIVKTYTLSPGINEIYLHLVFTIIIGVIVVGNLRRNAKAFNGDEE